MKSCISPLLGLLLVITCIAPALAVTTYVGASPQISAVVSGTNQFVPGEDAKITVIILNYGTPDMKQVMLGTIDRDDLPTTAKMVTISLGAGTAPVVIRSDSQNIGDIPSKGLSPVNILAKITSNATDGEYQLPLNVTYTYLADSTQVAADVLQSQYRTKSETIPLTIYIKPEVKIDVVEVSADPMSVGTGGFVTMKIRNMGFEDGKKATVRLLRNEQSPIIPTDSSVYVGDFPSDGFVTCRYRVSISSEAENETYPVDVAVTYENREGEVVTSASDTIGIPVNNKVTFRAVPEAAVLSPGSEQVVVIRYTNTGSIPVFAAQARLSAVNPLSGTDDTSYLGDLKPGETATARYTLRADRDAETKVYVLDTEVRYRDALDNTQSSDIFRVPVTVTAQPAYAGASTLLLIVLILLLAGGAGYYLLIMGKKK